MILSVADLENGTTAAHEYGHRLGLLHPGSPNNELDFEVKGQPGIMATELSIVELPYTKNPEAGKNPQLITDPITGRRHVDNPLDRTKRAVTPMDVSNIYLHSITNQRQPQFGGISNIIYSSNGEIVRRKP